MRLLLGKSGETTVHWIINDKAVVKFYCIGCEGYCAEEVVDYRNDPISCSPYRNNNSYARIIFGIHSEIIQMQRRVPVKRNAVYFCGKCLEEKGIITKSESIIRKVTGCPPGDSSPMFIPWQGCWITCSVITGVNEIILFNFQTGIDAYNNILAALMELPGNPFRISDIESGSCESRKTG